MAAIKLLTNAIIEKIHVTSIKETRNTDKPLESEIAEASGLNNPTKANKVINTAICAIILF